MAVGRDQTLLFYLARPVPERLGRVLLLSKDSKPEPLLSTTVRQRNGTLSPDGRWVAFEAREGDSWEVYVRPFPNVSEGRFQVSQGGGIWPAWSPSGRELFWVANRDTKRFLMVASVKSHGPSTTFDWDEPTALFDMLPYIRSTMRGYDLAGDGRFVMVQVPGAAGTAERAAIHFVSHWFDELRARV